MKVGDFSELAPEDFKDLTKDFNDDLELLIGAINEIGRNVNSLARKSLNLTDNIQSDLRTFEVRAATDLPVIFSNRFTPQPPKVVVLTNCRQNVGVLWSTDDKNQINITSITGSPSYPITLNLLILW